MDGLSPHLEYRIGRLHQEADTRRLAESASTFATRPDPPRRRVRAIAIATALVAISVTIGSIGSMLVLATDAGVPAPGNGDEPLVLDPAFGRGRVNHR